MALSFETYLGGSVITIAAGLFDCGNCYNILLIPVSGRSHFYCVAAIGRELMRRGHDVTMIIGDNFKVCKELDAGMTIERYYCADDEPCVDNDEQLANLTKLYMGERSSANDMIRLLSPIVERNSRRLLVNNEPMLERLTKVGFDIAVVDGLMFVERLVNAATFLSFHFVKLVPEPREEILDGYRRFGLFDSTNDLVARSLLWLSSKDDYPKPSMPNIIDVGGLTAGPVRGTLTSNLKLFTSDAKDGVNLVTLGSMTANTPLSIAEKFLSAFRRLSDFKIIWRFSRAEHNLAIPDNVFASKRLPQNDILADSKVKLFITHCGTNGQFESTYHGVPMLGFPLPVDQSYNAARPKSKASASS